MEIEIEGRPTTSRSRHDGSRRLDDGTVLVVGIGALGSTVAHVLARSGVGRILLVDPDVVEVSNLHRQILHRTSTIGQAKVLSAATFLRSRFPALTVETHHDRLDATNLVRYFAGADFVVDATDGVTSKFLLNDGAVLTGQPFSHAGILGFGGQTMTIWPRRTACYRCLFPEAPAADEVASCQEAGIVGGVAGFIGSVQAGEAVRYLLGEPPALLERLLTYDGLSGKCRQVALRRNPHCPLCGEHPTIGNLAATDHAMGVNR